jgi:hypothetical protein
LANSRTAKRFPDHESINDGVPPGHQDRDVRSLPNENVNGADHLTIAFGHEQGGVFVA